MTQTHSHRSPVTAGVKAGIECDTQHGAVTPALYLSSNYSFEGFDQKRQYDYTRSGNPTRDILGDALAELEGGSIGVITSTGMSSILLVLQLLAVGDRVIAPHDCYGGTHRLLTNLAARGHFDVDFVNQGDPIALKQALEKPTQLVWVETPSNPLLRVIDIQAVSELAHAQGALVAVDNTFLSPLWQKPLDLGADIVTHSTTKYLNGHSDVVGGAVIAKEQELGEKLAWWANCLGITGAPFDSLLTLRGIRTLGARLRVHEENTNELLTLLKSKSQVAKIYHPSLPEHPGHQVALKQQKGFGAIISFELKGGREAARRFCESLREFSLAESLGGVESLVCHPATMTHAAMDEQARQTAGIGEGLIRLSVGIEDANDLLNDLEQALDQLDRLQVVA